MEQTTGQETPEQMQARHRKEARDLQGRITNKKKNATKKTRKGVNDECELLERQMKERHEAELRGLAGGGADADADAVQGEEAAPEADVAAVSEQLKAASLAPASSSEGGQANGASGADGPKKRNRQKERLARRAAEQEAAAAAAASEAEGMVDHRAAEQKRMSASIAANGLAEHAIAPDGHCMFAAVADQLAQEGLPVSPAAQQQGQKEEPYRIVRAAAAEYMARHPDDFAPFLDGETLEEHTDKIRDTAEWGGQLELVALAGAYGIELRVVQDGRVEVVKPPGGKEKEGKGPIWLAYYRHNFGLGEHYNSLRKKAKAGAA